MRDWLKKQVTVGNILMVLVLVVTMFRNSTAWVIDLTTSSGKTASAVSKLVEQTAKLEQRVDTIERDRLIQSEIIAREFPRRSELEPRLKAIEDSSRENNILLRRMLEGRR